MNQYPFGKPFIPMHLLKCAALMPALGVLLVGCTTSSKDGNIAGVGLLYEQRGESTAKVDGEQLAKVIDKATSAFTIAGQAKDGLELLKGAVATTDTKASEAKEKAGNAVNVSNTANDKSTEAKAEAKAARDEAAKLTAELGITKEQLATAQKALDGFKDTIKEKLVTITADQVRAIAEVKDDREKFDKKVEDTLKEHKLTDAEIKEFQDKTKGMSTNEILAMLATGVGAAGAGGALAKSGKSRSQPQIDKNTEAINDLKHTTVKRPG